MAAICVAEQPTSRLFLSEVAVQRLNEFAVRVRRRHRRAPPGHGALMEERHCPVCAERLRAGRRACPGLGRQSAFRFWYGVRLELWQALHVAPYPVRVIFAAFLVALKTSGRAYLRKRAIHSEASLPEIGSGPGTQAGLAVGVGRAK